MRSLRGNNFGFKALNRLLGGGVHLKNLGGEFADVIFPTL